MKRIAFKTLSILLAAVLLVAALPVVAFAEIGTSCNHIFEECAMIDYDYAYDSSEYHLVTEYCVQCCRTCGELGDSVPIDSYLEYHTPDDTVVDPEVDMSGPCLYCGGIFDW